MCYGRSMSEQPQSRKMSRLLVHLLDCCITLLVICLGYLWFGQAGLLATAGGIALGGILVALSASFFSFGNFDDDDLW